MTTFWTITSLIALVCIVVLFTILRRALKEGREQADKNKEIYDSYINRHIAPKP